MRPLRLRLPDRVPLVELGAPLSARLTARQALPCRRGDLDAPPDQIEHAHPGHPDRPAHRCRRETSRAISTAVATPITRPRTRNHIGTRRPPTVRSSSRKAIIRPTSSALRPAECAPHTPTIADPTPTVTTLPRMAITLDDHDVSTLKVLLDNAVPRQPGGPMNWEGAGRRAAESLLGFRDRCRCTGTELLDYTSPAPGCAVHDVSD